MSILITFACALCKPNLKIFLISYLHQEFSTLSGRSFVIAAVRRASLNVLAKRHGINPKTVAKWRKREFTHDAPMGPKEAHSTVLGLEEGATVVAFRKHTLLPLDDCLYALQPSIPHLTRSSLHRCFQRHDISRLPGVEGDKPKKKFNAYPIGYCHRVHLQNLDK